MTKAPLTVVALLICGRSAAADPESDRLIDYYDGEQTAAYVVGTLGGAAAATGAWLVSKPDGLSRSLGWTWVGLGGVEAIGAIAYTFQVHHEIHHYETLLANEPLRYRSEEIDHIRGVGSRFVGYRIAEIALVVGGGALAAYGFAADHDTWKGVGLGIATLSLPLAVIDTLNNARAHRYLRSLEGDAPIVGVAALQHGAAISLGGRF